MRYLITTNKDKYKLLTVQSFDSLDSCNKKKKEMTKLWTKMVKNEPLLPKTRLKLWKSCIFVPFSIEERFVDVEMFYKQETSKNNKQPLAKALKQHDENIIQRKVNRRLKNETRQYKKV